MTSTGTPCADECNIQTQVTGQIRLQHNVTSINSHRSETINFPADRKAHIIGYKHPQAGTTRNTQPDTDTSTWSDTNNIDYSKNNPPLNDFGRDINHYLKKIYTHTSLFCKPFKSKTLAATTATKAFYDSSYSNVASGGFRVS